MLVLLLPGHGIGGDVCCFPEQAADFSAVQIRLDLAAVAGRVPDGQHHGRGGRGEEPQQGNGPGQLVRGQVGQAPQGQDLGGQGLEAGVYVDGPELDDPDHPDEIVPSLLPAPDCRDEPLRVGLLPPVVLPLRYQQDSVVLIPERGHDLDREPAAEPFVFGQEAWFQEALDDVIAEQGLPHDVPGQ
jgi:hypothetical protein